MMNLLRLFDLVCSYEHTLLNLRKKYDEQTHQLSVLPIELQRLGRVGTVQSS